MSLTEKKTPCILPTTSYHQLSPPLYPFWIKSSISMTPHLKFLRDPASLRHSIVAPIIHPAYSQIYCLCLSISLCLRICSRSRSFNCPEYTLRISSLIILAYSPLTGSLFELIPNISHSFYSFTSSKTTNNPQKFQIKCCSDRQNSIRPIERMRRSFPLDRNILPREDFLHRKQIT